MFFSLRLRTTFLHVAAAYIIILDFETRYNSSKNAHYVTIDCAIQAQGNRMIMWVVRRNHAVFEAVCLVHSHTNVRFKYESA
jgi:hypothetical protein